VSDPAGGERVAIVGAGSVGLVLGARLASSGCDVLFLTRRAEQAARLAREGVLLEDPATQARVAAPVRATHRPERAAAALADRPLVFCTRTPDLARAAAALARLASGAVAVAAQNGVDPEALLAEHFPRTLGLVVRQTCTRVDDRAARATGSGRLVVGTRAASDLPHAEALARWLARAGYDVGLARDLAADRWLKLCVNLMSAPNALVVRRDHETAEFVEVKARLLEEARGALAAARIRAASCDGRDRSLAGEIAHQRDALARGTSARTLPLYNQVWSALRRGGPLEADGYHETVLALARRHGVPAPVNRRVLDLLRRAARESLGPESLRAADLLPSGRADTRAW
jgi:2-dehydropantoate 2-reductase